MRLVGLVCLTTLHLAAGIELQVQVAQPEVAPRSFVSLVLQLRNTGSQDETVDLSLQLPERWQTLSPLAPVVVPAGQQLRRLVTVAVPFDAPAHVAHTIACRASTASGAISTAGTQLTVRRVRGLAVQLLPHEERAYPGEAIRYRVAISNRGNAADTFIVTAESTHRWKLYPPEQQIVVPPGQTSIVDVVVQVPTAVYRPTVDRIQMTIVAGTQPGQGEPASEQLVASLATIPSIPPGDDSIYHQLPAVLSLTLRERTDQPMETEMRFSMGGDLPDGYFTSLDLRQTYEIQGESTELDYLRFDFGNDHWDISLGDTYEAYSRLTSDLYGRGARLRLRGEYLDGSLFLASRDMGSGREERSFGTQIAGRPAANTWLALSHVHLQQKSSGDAPAYTSESRQLSLLLLQQMTRIWRLSGEIAASDGHEAERELDGLAWRVTSELALGRLGLAAELYRAESDFTGAMRDREGYRAYGRFALSRKTTLWAEHEQYRNNVDADPTLTTTTTTRTVAGSHFALQRWPVITLSGEYRQDQRDGGMLAGNDSEELTGRLRLYKQHRWLSLAAGGEWGQRHYSDGSSTMVGYDLSVTADFRRVYTRLGYRYHERESRGDRSHQSDTQRMEVEAGCRLLANRLHASVGYHDDIGSATSRQGSLIRVRAAYSLSRNSTISLHSEFHDRDGSATTAQHQLTWTYRFGAPVPFLKTRSRAGGRIFVDANHNGIYDHGEDVVGKLPVSLGNQQLYTDPDGSFRFAPVTPGQYALAVDTSELPANLRIANLANLQLELQQPGDSFIDIALHEVGMISGAVFEDTNGNGLREDGEAPTARIRVWLTMPDGQRMATWTDALGRYRFTDLELGSHTVELDAQTLPHRYQLTSPGTVTIDMAAAAAVADFGCRPAPREIIRTFSQ